MTKIKGLDKLIKDLRKFGDEGEKMVQEVTAEKVQQIVTLAKQNAPKNNGKLGQSIRVEENTKLNYSAVVGASYGAYVEFGTGKHVSVPSEMKDIASKFKGKSTGTFEEGLQAIKDWCKNKGIDVKLAYPIFMSILREGIAPQPYLYPAYVSQKKQYLKDLNNELERLTKKIK